MGTVATRTGVLVDTKEWELTKKQAQLSCELWQALLGGLDAAGMGAMVPVEIRTKIAEVTKL